MRTVIIGAGPTGLFTAITLARRGGQVSREVVVIDRDPGPPRHGPWKRRGVMQFQQAHTFRGPVVEALHAEMPDVLDTLVSVGAEIVTAPNGVAVAALCRREVFEAQLRRQAALEPGVTLVTGHADFVLRERGRVTGVSVDGRRVPADLVIDAAGRASRVTRSLRPPAQGGPCEAVYVSRQYRLHRRDARGPVNSPIGLSLGFAGYFAVVFVHDNGTFSVTLAHDGRDPRLRALRRAEVFDAVVEAIPLVADWVHPAVSAPITAVLPGGQLYNSYRGQAGGDGLVVPGLIAVGDAVCTTTPLAGRGVALAFQQVQRLTAILTAYPGDVVAAATAFDDWCDARIRPWFDDHVRCDADRIRRWSGGDVDLSAPLPSDLIVAAAAADPRLRPKVEPYERMLALPSSLDVLQPVARALYLRGWRPAVPAGPTHSELAELCDVGLITRA
jgi:2-polyprenyl-6-methoxyphenol hydroxylase-like FAD-dependent oxidoreductase